MLKTRFKPILLLALVFAIALVSGITTLFISARGADAETTAGGYYYSQLNSEEAKAIYNALSDMNADGALKTGTETWDLVEKGYLSNREYEQTALTSAFGAGKDAFMLDNADLFYVDLDKISLRYLTDGTNYKITLGIGRESDYLADGFTASDVDGAVTAFEAKADEIATAASQAETLRGKILAVYESVMDGAVYALEFDAGDDADYVRCAYGVLVKGKGVCQSFSQAVKTILDKMGITCVLVNGTFIDGDGNQQAHMWNYVQMDDNRWYILDATMDNALRDGGDADSLKYFLMNGSDAAGLYVPNGVISTSYFEFEYPSLSMADYEVPSSNFTFETATTSSGSEYQKISYNGMGLRAAEKQGYYILATFSVNTETDWFYVISQMRFALENSGGDIDNYDFDSYFSGQLLGGADYILAVTTDAPDKDAAITDIYYSGDNIFDKSSAVLDIEDEKPPYAVSVSPDSLRFYIGSSYNVTVTFNDNLTKIDTAEAVTVTFSVPDGVTLNSPDGVITNVVWSQSNPSQISFTFTPDKNYSADRCGYTLTFGNVAGETSGKAPVSTILTALYKPSFSCPVNPLSYCMAVATVPQLISDGDLSVEGWTYTDANGVEQTVTSSSLSAKISLVATTYTGEANAEYEEAVNQYNQTAGNGTTVLESATYDLSLNLCDVQVNYLNGNKVQILVPFPEGYSAESAGVSFKAYHFADSGEIEEIDCYCTEYGIVLFCSSFSAYTIAAVDGAEDNKNVLVTCEGHGSSSENLVAVASGGKLSVTLTADEGYCIDSVTIGGTTISVDGAAVYELEKTYDELDGNTTVIVKFASAEVVSGELEQGLKIAASVVKTETEGNGGEDTDSGETDGDDIMLILTAFAVLAGLVILALIVTAIMILRNKIKRKGLKD